MVMDKKTRRIVSAKSVIVTILILGTFYATKYYMCLGNDPYEMMDRIHEDMTFSEVAEIIPLSKRRANSLVEYGGVFYDVPICGKYLIQLRFNHPVGSQSIEETIINFSPRLRDRRTLVFLSGKEESWPVRGE